MSEDDTRPKPEDCQSQKHPCPDCKMCQWCADSKCRFCQGWLVKKKDDSVDTGKEDE